MRLDTGQHLSLEQRMRLDPRMIQSMEILQLSQPALEARIESELANNPTLELLDGGESAPADPSAGPGEASLNGTATDAASDANSDANSETSGFERLDSMAGEYGESFASNVTEGGDFAQRQSRKFYGERDAKMDAMANTAARGASLYEQLMDQWRMLEVEAPYDEAGAYLMGLIDADGYLRTVWAEVVEQSPESVDEDQLEETLELIQFELEPAGLGARDLRECLLVQIDDRARREPDRDFTVPRLLVDKHLPDIEANRLPQIGKQANLTIEQIKTGMMMLRQFTPHPGRQLHDDDPVGITPDAVVEMDEHTDTYTATLTNGRLPSLSIAPNYEDMFKDKQLDGDTKKFLGNQLRNGRWLIEAIEQRANTLLRVIAVVVQAQRAFFEDGPQALKPLPMTGVADQLGLHVSTVSRAVAGKYIQTPRGIFALRMFFSGGTADESGKEMAWGAVEARVKGIVDNEDKSAPLSDDAIVAKLKAEGVELARRTVAKYRSNMNIPTARQRKQF